MPSRAADQLCALADLFDMGQLSADEFVSAAQGLADDVLEPERKEEAVVGVQKGACVGLQLFVQTQFGGTHAVDVPIDATVKQVKEEICRMTSVPPRQQALWFAGQRLTAESDSTELADIGVSQEAVLQLSSAYTFLWRDDPVPKELEVVSNTVAASKQAPKGADLREAMPFAISTEELMSTGGLVSWEMQVQGCKGGLQPGRLRHAPSATDPSDSGSVHVGIAAADFDTSANFHGAITWSSNGGVTMDFKNCGCVSRDVVRSERLKFGSGSLVGFQFDTQRRMLSLWKNGQRVHVVGPPALYLDSYRAVCTAGESASVSLLTDTTF